MYKMLLSEPEKSKQSRNLPYHQQTFRIQNSNRLRNRFGIFISLVKEKLKNELNLYNERETNEQNIHKALIWFSRSQRILESNIQNVLI